MKPEYSDLTRDLDLIILGTVHTNFLKWRLKLIFIFYDYRWILWGGKRVNLYQNVIFIIYIIIYLLLIFANNIYNSTRGHGVASFLVGVKAHSNCSLDEKDSFLTLTKVIWFIAFHRCLEANSNL